MDQSPLGMLSPAALQAAARRLQAQGMPLTKTNLAEMAAAMSDAPVAPVGKAIPPAAVRGGPSSDAAARAAAAIEAKRRAGPPADMLARQARLARSLQR